MQTYIYINIYILTSFLNKTKNRYEPALNIECKRLNDYKMNASN